VANTTYTWPDPDDEIFSPEFTVIFPIRLEKSADGGKPKPPPKPSAPSSKGEGEQPSR
jgi:hypothetical protein